MVDQPWEPREYTLDNDAWERQCPRCGDRVGDVYEEMPGHGNDLGLLLEWTPSCDRCGAVLAVEDINVTYTLRVKEEPNHGRNYMPRVRS